MVYEVNEVVPNFWSPCLPAILSDDNQSGFEDKQYIIYLLIVVRQTGRQANQILDITVCKNFHTRFDVRYTKTLIIIKINF